MVESIKEHKEILITGFWAGVGFWAAQRLVRFIDMSITEYLMEGF